MSNILEHRGYRAAVEFDAEDGLFFGRIAGIADGVGFHADSVSDLVGAFREAVDDYLETCAKVGKTPDRPYSGKVLLRIDPALHARTAQAAELAGLSLNQWAERLLRSAVAVSS
ncbi:antitoxin HicB [alpha proteobacterium AAP81b]|nr:antitoxin HicB [alpha proteobacterium AAP81b]